MVKFPRISLILPAAVLLLVLSCGHKGARSDADGGATEAVPAEPAVEPVQEAPGQAPVPDSGVADENLPKGHVYGPARNRNNCFFVISKAKPVRLSVYEKVGRDTVLRATYPACVAKAYGNKQRKGDNRTPESYPGKPFLISQIQDASGWTHDFGDGRGAIKAYGSWFIRLETPGFTGIGIHGSTNNRASIAAGRGSEGCIRLLDEDIVHLKENYTINRIPVIILPEDIPALPFEKRLRVESSITVPAVPEPVAPKDTAAVAEEKPEAVVPVEEKVEVLSVEPAVKPVTGTPGHLRVVQDESRVRTGPDPSCPLYTNADGGNKLLPKGKVLVCTGESGNYYKVMVEEHEVYINKVSVEVMD